MTSQIKSFKPYSYIIPLPWPCRVHALIESSMFFPITATYSKINYSLLYTGFHSGFYFLFWEGRCTAGLMGLGVQPPDAEVYMRDYTFTIFTAGINHL